MRRAIIHIGMPRTGSTSFQEVLAGLRPKLAEAGLLYPELAPPGAHPDLNVNHQPLGEVLDGRRPRAERAVVLGRLDAALLRTQADTVILSYEDFSVQRPHFRVPEILREILARRGFALEVLMVVKPPFAFLNSAYAHRAQLIRETGSFRDYLAHHWRSGRIDYRALVAPWAEAADGRVTALPLADRRSAEPLVGRIVAALGLGDRLGKLIGAQAAGYRTNRSSGPVAVEASRRLRALRVHRQIAGHPRCIGHALDQAAWARGLDPAPFRGDAPEYRARIAAHTFETRERFAQLAWGRSWDAVVAPDRDLPPNELAHRAIPAETEAQVAALVRETMRRFDFRAPAPHLARSAAWIEGGALGLARLAGIESRWRVC
jgi:hypothetical protein